MENNCAKVLVLVTDSAPYTLKAAKALQVFYSNLIHVTCLAHGLDRIAEKICELFPAVNDLVTNGKKLFLKAPVSSSTKIVYLKFLFLLYLSYLGGGIWLSAVSFYQKHFNEVKEVVLKLENDYAYVHCISRCEFYSCTLFNFFKNHRDVRILWCTPSRLTWKH